MAEIVDSIDPSLPKVLQVALQFYDALDDLSNGEIFQGSTVKVFDSICNSRSYYPSMVRILTAAHAISKEGSYPTRIRLYERPTAEDLFAAKDLTDSDETATMQAQYERLAERVAAQEARLGEFNLVEALRNHEKRISQLEAHIQSLLAELETGGNGKES